MEWLIGYQQVPSNLGIGMDQIHYPLPSTKYAHFLESLPNSPLIHSPSPAPLSMDGILTTEAAVWMTSSEFCLTGDFFSVFTRL